MREGCCFCWSSWRGLWWWLGLLFAIWGSVCRGQVNIIGIPRFDQAVELVLRNAGGQEIDATRPFGPLTVGATLVLFCETKHPTVSHLAWSRDGVEVYGAVSRFSDGLLQNELRVPVSVPADRTAEYKCRGLNLRMDPVVEKSLRVEVSEHAQVPFSAAILPANGTFKANETVTLRCLVHGSRGPAIITWWREERLLNESTVSATPGITVRNGVTATESNLTFKVTTADHGVPIYCRAVSALSQLHENTTAEAVLRLDIYYHPIASIPKNETITVKENGPVSIVCALRSFPPVDRVRWYRSDKLVFEDRMKTTTTASPSNSSDTGSSSTAAKTDLQTNSLRILQMSRSDVGLYSCEAHNSAGWSARSNSVEVKVQYKAGMANPAKTAKQQATTEIHAAEGEKLTMTCAVADLGNPPATQFVWRKEGAYLSRSQTYTINQVQEKHFGSYTCAPWNGSGEGDAAAINLTKKEEAVLQASETTVLMIASILGVVGGTILLAIVIWCLCLSKSCRNRNKNNHLTSTFMTGTYPPHGLPPLLPRPHLITTNNSSHHQQHHHQSSTLSRENNPPPRPCSQLQKQQQISSSSSAQVSPGSGASSGFMFGNSYSHNNNNPATTCSAARPNYYPSWYSQRTERTNSYLGRNYNKY
ncbi:hypothetical protein BV898_00647 [Hypsibius exemplaris]|uniref:Ig-like domain-containing protein n=1 Tax=Hypsibius exemplaris TaxID=2072580 RepID=A0A1W0XE26_HYPEX|nr:hypothetical protein BV898_00647 [Hypsibius exemplaris]